MHHASHPGSFLSQGRVAEATSLARRHSHAPHFSRSLEWLLFTALEFNADDMPSPAKSAPASAPSSQHSPGRPRRGSTAGSLLLAAAALIRAFPQVLLTLSAIGRCAWMAAGREAEAILRMETLQPALC